ncbi:TetR family transcriptional regulator C-terminal domain-containing protein, partial [Phenylobacterium sp.]
SEAFRRWRAPLAGALARAQARGEIAMTVEAAVMADFIQNGLQGALLRAKVDRTSASIDQFKMIVLNLLAR